MAAWYTSHIHHPSTDINIQQNEGSVRKNHTKKSWPGISCQSRALGVAKFLKRYWNQMGDRVSETVINGPIGLVFLRSVPCNKW